MAKQLTRCPVCDSALRITELTCGQCQTRIQSQFETCRFCQLAPEHLAFLESFLRCEGNLSRVEKEWNLSYPTIRNRFAALLEALGFSGDAGETPNRREPSPEVSVSPPTPDFNPRRRAVLEALSRGKITAEEAAIKLSQIP